MRKCLYRYCDNDISHKIRGAKYCCKWHANRQNLLNRKKDFMAKTKIYNGFENLKPPTIITPQAERYQDLLGYSTTVMSNFK